jgi:hypothetical protein
VLTVIARFLERLLGNAGQHLVGRMLQRLPLLHGPAGQPMVAHGGVCEVAAWQFRECDVEELALLAQIGELIFIEARFAQTARMREQSAGLAEQIQRDVGQGDVFFECRRVAAPFAEAVRPDQAGVCQAQDGLRLRRGFAGDRGRHHK